jgi:hypothetical protein
VTLEARDEGRTTLSSLARGLSLEPGESAALAGQLERVYSGPELLELAHEDLATEDLRVELTARATALGARREARALLLAFSRDEALVLDTRVKAAIALSEAGRPRLAARELVDMVRGVTTTTAPDWATRLQALWALRELRRAREIAALALDPAESIEVRVPAAEALWALDRAEQGRAILLDLARDVEGEHWDHDIIGHAFEDRGLIEELVGLTREPAINPGMRTMAIYVLGNRGHGERVLAIARDRNAVPDARVIACRVLETLGWDQEGSAVLVSLARDPELEVEAREEAAVALRGPERADLLLELALDEEVHPSVRCSCLFGLVETRDGEVAKTLERLARADPSPRVRDASAFTAAEIRVRLSSARWRRWAAPFRSLLGRDPPGPE